MSTIKSVLWVTGVVLLVMAVLCGCSLLLRDSSEQSGWYIALNIGDPAGAKAINVGEYDVTEVQVAIYAPGDDQPLWGVTWYAQDPPLSEIIPVSEEGQYRVEVTHIGDNNGEPVEATESAFFNVKAMVITVIEIIPGCIGTINVEPGGEQPPEPPCPGLVGCWFGSAVETPGLWFVDAHIVLSADGTYETLLFDVGGDTLQNMSSRGTSQCVEGTLSTQTEQYYIDGEWIDGVFEWETQYTLVGDTLILHQDYYPEDAPDGIPDTDWFLIRSVTNGLVAYYPFNGNANDESGNGNHGSVFGSTLTPDRFGNPDSAYDFDGISAYIMTHLDIDISTMPELTMSVWLYPRRTGPEDDGVVDHGRRHILSSSDGDLDRSLVVKLGYWEIQMGGERWISGFPVEINTWQHIVVVFGTSEVKFYKNGVLYQILLFSGFGSTISPLTIGDNASHKWYQPYDGIVDSVRIYNRALSSSEVQELYNEAD